MRFCARTIWDAAISSKARVIFLVASTVRIRLRRIRTTPPATLRPPGAPGGSLGAPGVEAVEELAELLVDRAGVRELAGVADRRQQLRRVGAQELAQLGLEPTHLGDRDAVDEAPGAGVDHEDLLLHRHRVVLRLLEQLGEP